MAGQEKVRYWDIDKMGDMGQFTDFTGKNTANNIDYTIGTENATLTLKDLSRTSRRRVRPSTSRATAS